MITQISKFKGSFILCALAAIAVTLPTVVQPTNADAQSGMFKKNRSAAPKSNATPATEGAGAAGASKMDSASTGAGAGAAGAPKASASIIKKRPNLRETFHSLLT